MDTTAIISSITLLVILVSTYIGIRAQIKPRLKVYFPDGSTKATYKAKEEAAVTIHIKNIGRFSFPKPAATQLGILVYTPNTFLLKEYQCIGGTTHNPRKASSGGIFGGMDYLGMRSRTLTLFSKEEEVIKVVMQMPEATGRYTIKIAIISYEGDLGVHKVDIIVR